MKKSLLIMFFLPIIVIGQNPILVDGFFDDWNSNSIIFYDDSLDTEGVDLLQFSVCNDDKNIYFRLILDSEIDLSDSTDLYARIRLYIDRDNNNQTGYPVNGIGSEYGIDFNEKLMFNDVFYPENTVQTSLYELNIIPLPTITSNEFEISLDRTGFSDTISFSFEESVDGDKMPNSDQIFEYILNDNSVSSIPNISFEKFDSNYIRIMTYNILSNGINNPNRREQLKRVISSVDADIFTFNECGGVSLEQMENFFSEFSEENWYMDKFDGGDITVSRYPIIETFSDIDLKIGASLVDLPDSIYLTDFLVINAHLACCGGDYSRQISADKFIKFIHECKDGLIPFNTPFTFSGDMNLVGYKQQYETIINGSIVDTDSYGFGGLPDWDNSPIVDNISQFNESNQSYTWREINPLLGSYPPGRLDFIFYSNSVISIDKTFVINTKYMSLDMLSSNNLIDTDTEIASDHLPVIADLVFPSNLVTYNCIEGSCLNPGDGSGIYSSLSECKVECSVSLIKEKKSIKKLKKITGLLGQEILIKKNTPMLYIYDDGTVDKKVIIE